MTTPTEETMSKAFAAMRAALEAVEWTWDGEAWEYRCPSCEGRSPDEDGADVGHRPGCQLAAALASARGERPE
jgi:hypothetical protein